MIPITIVNHETTLPDKHITVTLSHPVNVSLGSSTYNGTIQYHADGAGGASGSGGSSGTDGTASGGDTGTLGGSGIGGILPGGGASSGASSGGCSCHVVEE